MSGSLAALVLALATQSPLHGALPQAQAGKILSSEIAISRDRAEIKLEFEDGRKVLYATVSGSENRLRAGAAPMQRSGTLTDEIITLAVQRGDAVDRSWRDLLNRAMEVDAAELAPLLKDWNAPAGSGSELFDQTLEAALAGDALPATPAAQVAPGMNDSVVKLEIRLKELEELLDDARGDAISASRRNRGPDWLAPLRHVGRGVSGIFATLVTYAVIFGLGFATVMFGGRKYIEGVADTARANTGRSFLVGLAGAFLLLPVFVLGVIALAISIVGIPALLVWIPLFPVGALVAAILGFLGMAHAAGERWAERRYYGSEWFTRANSYYFMATGLALFAACFVAADVVTMAGPWLGFINNILNFFGVLLTLGAVTTGFGAVLISRGGTRVDSSTTSMDSAEYSEANA